MPNAPTIGVFASTSGPGDAERAAIMSQMGRLLARKGARLVCLANEGDLPVPLVTAARGAGGEVIVLMPAGAPTPKGLEGITVEPLPNGIDGRARLDELAALYLALPGSLASATSLFRSLASCGETRKPVVFYDHNGAFRVLRGFAGDVIANSLPHYHRELQFADSIEDVWGKIMWLAEQQAVDR